jgi:hypothetical protein
VSKREAEPPDAILTELGIKISDCVEGYGSITVPVSVFERYLLQSMWSNLSTIPDLRVTKQDEFIEFWRPLEAVKGRHKDD